MNRPYPIIPLPGSFTPAPRKSRRNLLLALCSWGYLAVILGMWILAGWADQWWLASLMMFAPLGLLAAPLLILVPWACLVRSRYLLLLVMTAVLVAGPVMGFCIPWQSLIPSRPIGPPVRVLTCNLHYGVQDTKPMATLIADTSPDIVALQEWKIGELPDLRAETGWYVHRTRQLYLASRYPIKKSNILGTNSFQPEGLVGHFELEAPFGVVHLFNLHFASPRKGLFQTVHEEGDEGPVEIDGNTEIRMEQSANVALAASKVEGPVLLVGDFNTPPQSVIFDRLWSKYTDAFVAAGWGWGYTYHGDRTLVRIDHILAGKGWNCTRCWVGPKVGSPHRPVVAHLVWTGSE